jgi:predicted transcriptional regulator
MNALLSIKPRYAEAILSGEKKWEFRRRGFKETPEKIFIYCTNPIKKVVGFFEVGDVIYGSSEEIWKKCRRKGTISREEFFRYSSGAKVIYAIKISSVKKFKCPIELNSFRKSRSPQSFYYIEGTHNFHSKHRKFFFHIVKRLISKLNFFGGGSDEFKV